MSGSTSSLPTATTRIARCSIIRCIVDAHYDAAANKTIVRGRYETERILDGIVVLEFFASSTRNARGHAQAERFLGDLRTFQSHADFEFSADGDLTRQWIAATATIESFSQFNRDVTSELSDAIQVTP